MSKKSFDDIEAFIKQLAEAHEPAFEEEAWVKMERLLDKEDRRKRPLFFLWWLLPLVLAAGLIFYFSMENRPTSRIAIVPGKNQKPIAGPEKNVQTKINETTPTTTNLSTGERVKGTTDISHIPALLTATKQTPIGYDVSTVNGNVGPHNNPAGNTKKNPAIIQAFQTNSLTPIVDSKDKPGKNNNESLPESTSSSDKQTIPETIDKKQQTPKVDEWQEINKTEKGAVKISKSKSAIKSFYLLAGGGVEMNGLGLLPFDNATARFSVGLGYKLNRRLSVQTGFYSSSKKYIAGAGDYKPKAGTYWSTVDIKSVNADCRVYEVPLTVRYDFKSEKNLTYFSALGLSSFIMQKEDYRYQYEHYGIPYNSSASYKGNKHFFSVARLAAGVEKPLNSNWSLQVSPGFSVPLAGVGEGQVKLFSTDIMFAVKFSPGPRKK